MTASFAEALADRLEHAHQVDRWRADPAVWAAERLGVHLWSKQRDIAGLLVQQKRVAVQSAHGTGKSFLGAILSLWWADVWPADDVLVVTTAPTYEQVHSILWEEIRRNHLAGKLPGEVQLADRWMIDGKQVGLGRKPADSQAFQGHHRRRLLAIIDESCGVPAWTWTAVEAITTGPECRLLALGNPDDNASEFARVCQQDRSWRTVKVSAFDVPAMTGEQVPARLHDVLVSPEWIGDKQDRWGESNPLYRAKVLGEFADSEDGIIPLSWVKAAQARWTAWDEAGRPTQPGRRIVGVDVARYGEDQTCLAVRHGDVIREVRTFAKLDTTQITGLVEAELERAPQAMAQVDVIGVGAGVVDQLRDHGRNVRAFNASTATKRRDSTGAWRYRNVRSAAWWNLRELLDPHLDATLALPPDDELAAELTVPRWSPATGGVIQVEAKDDIRKRLGRSTDRADAVCMAMWDEPTPALDEHGRAAGPRVFAYADSVGGWA